jgi:tRNA1(Val) A37 N6-methylase TrmN6
MKKNLDNYQSPDFYSFSEDSILLARIASEDIGKKISGTKVLDLGAGNGVVGIEFIKSSQVEKQWYLSCCEKQMEFKPYLQQNLISNDVKAEYYFQTFQSLDLNICFDVILFNPPYFSQESGRPSQNSNRHQCRFYQKDFFFDLERFVYKYLINNGNFYLLYRSDQTQIDVFFPSAKYQKKQLWQDQEFLRLICVLKL